MKMLPFLLSVLFFSVGFIILYSVSTTNRGYVTEEFSSYDQMRGEVATVGISKNAKNREVYSFRLKGVRESFDLMAHPTKDSILREELLGKIEVGDSILVAYTSLVGTQYEYDNAPFTMVIVEKNGEQFELSKYIDHSNDHSTFIWAMAYFLGGLFILIGIVLLFIFIRSRINK